MKDLKKLQEQFAAYLRGDADSAIMEDIVTDDKASAEERLGFYHDAYRLRLIEVLSLDYPGVAGLLGEEDFGRLALAYIRHYPSRYRSIRWFGLHLPDFLDRPRGEFERDEKLVEMARFEKAQNDVFDAEPSEPLSVEALAAVDPAAWSTLRVEFVPSMQRLDLNWDVPRVWLALRAQEGGEAGALKTPDWQRSPFPVAWLVWRNQLDPRWRALDVDEAWAIDRLAEGGSFGDVCEGLREWIDEANIPLRAVTILKTLFVDHLVGQLTTTCH